MDGPASSHQAFRRQTATTGQLLRHFSCKRTHTKCTRHAGETLIKRRRKARVSSDSCRRRYVLVFPPDSCKNLIALQCHHSTRSSCLMSDVCRLTRHETARAAFVSTGGHHSTSLRAAIRTKHPRESSRTWLISATRWHRPSSLCPVREACVVLRHHSLSFSIPLCRFEHPPHCDPGSTPLSGELQLSQCMIECRSRARTRLEAINQGSSRPELFCILRWSTLCEMITDRRRGSLCMTLSSHSFLHRQ